MTTPGAESTAKPQPPQVRRRVLERWFGPNVAGVIEWIVVVAGAILLALVVKVFLLQAFYIPSLSMYPALHEGDRVLVSKLSYKIQDVNRGDIIVFERPASETSSNIPDLIKRVVGLPGEAITIENGSVYADGVRLDEKYLPTGMTTNSANAPNKCTPDLPCIVPDGQLWVMGDNRGDSKDSRYFGPINQSTVVGKAFITVWPLGQFGLL
ncbi:MAG: signal peptidase I [Acidimicrobiales bacterium]